MNSVTVMFRDLSIESRIWIYQSNSSLSQDDQVVILKKLNQHLLSWKAHSLSLLAAAEVLFDRFIIIALDETVNVASGCSIDASTNWLKVLGAEHDVDFFDRSLVYVKDDQLKSIPLNNIRIFIESGELQKDTLVFNNNIQKLKQLNSDWKIAAENSWLKRYFE